MQKKKSGLAHLPNLTAFSPMLQEIDGRAEAWGTDVKVIKHDRESQIQALLRDWHRMLSNAREGTFSLFGKQFKTRVVSGSEFQISTSAESPGIQLADIVLWLIKKADERGSLGEPADSLLARVRSQAEPTELTIAYMISEAQRMDQYAASQPLTEEDWQRGKKLVDEAEGRRKRQMEAQPILVN